MDELLFLLLPLAFLSGWLTARKRHKLSQSKNRQLSRNFVQGINLLLNEEPDKALEVFLNHPDIDEYTADTYLLLGNMFRNRGEVDRALRVHQNLIGRANLGPRKKRSAMLAYGQDFLVAGMLDRAESVFQEVIKSNEKDEQACRSLRHIYEQLQDWEKAIEVTRCVEKGTGEDFSKEITHYYCELADIELEKGNIHRVEDYLALARKVWKDSARILMTSGDVALRQRDYAKALKTYQAAIEKDTRLLGLFKNEAGIDRFPPRQQQQFKTFLIKTIDKKKDILLLEYFIEWIAESGATDEDCTYIEAHFRQGLSSPKALLGMIAIWKSGNVSFDTEHYEMIIDNLESYLEKRSEFQCQHCGYQTSYFLWRCPACQHWDAIQ